MNLLSLFLIPLMVNNIGVAGNIHHLTVFQDENKYHAILHVTLSIPMHKVQHYLSDFNNWVGLLASVKKTTLLSHTANSQRIKSNLQGCVLFFCVDTQHVQDLIVMPDGNLFIYIIPALSDYSNGQATWVFKKVATHSTEIFMEVMVEPKFWIPAYIGPHLLKEKLYQESVAVVGRLEKMYKDEGNHGAKSTFIYRK